jgi:hypothetical protein
MFRSQTGAEIFESRHSDDGSLVGLNAKIPGGKYDSSLSVGGTG